MATTDSRGPDTSGQNARKGLQQTFDTLAAELRDGLARYWAIAGDILEEVLVGRIRQGPALLELVKLGQHELVVAGRAGLPPDDLLQDANRLLAHRGIVLKCQHTRLGPQPHDRFIGQIPLSGPG